MDLAGGRVDQKGRTQFRPPCPVEAERREESGLGRAHGVLGVQEVVADLRRGHFGSIEEWEGHGPQTSCEPLPSLW